MLYGTGNMGRRGGRGFGFQGTMPPWPYVGRGKGGLPRCGYYSPAGSSAPLGTAAAGSTGKEREIDYLKSQAGALKKQVEQIELRISNLEAD
jgi:hypothetical protein